MRIIADVSGSIFFAIGILAILGAILIMATVAVAIGVPIFCTGVIIMVVGWLIFSVATRKPCLSYGKNVKGKALTCKRCGYEFSTTPSIFLSEPWGFTASASQDDIIRANTVETLSIKPPKATKSPSKNTTTLITSAGVRIGLCSS